MIIEDTIIEHTIGNTSIRIDVVNWCEGSPWFRDLYRTTDQHEAGITIQIPPEYSPGPEKYVIGQYTPAELARDYAAQGRENPSKAAYESLQRELRHYIEAQDCTLRCTVSKAGIELAESYGISFDYSSYIDETIEEMGALMLREYGRDFVHEAVLEARNTLAKLAA